MKRGLLASSLYISAILLSAAGTIHGSTAQAFTYNDFYVEPKAPPKPGAKPADTQPSADDIHASYKPQNLGLFALPHSPTKDVHTASEEPPMPSPTATAQYFVSDPTSLEARLINLFGEEVGPALLSAQDTSLYQQIALAQKTGDWQSADRLIAQLRDKRLMGYVLQQRYMHPTKWRSSYKELSSWLDQYADHSGADSIYELAIKRKGASAASPKEPFTLHGIAGSHGNLGNPSSMDLSMREPARTKTDKGAKLAKSVLRAINKRHMNTALDMLNSHEKLPQYDADHILSQIAAGFYYYTDNTRQAYKLSSSAAIRSGQDVPLALWIRGLSAWRLGEYRNAADSFAMLATSDHIGALDRSAAFYWAGRAYDKTSRRAMAEGMFNKAAKFPRTFYGMIARQSLGLPYNIPFIMPAPEPKHAHAMGRNDFMKRILGLMQTNQMTLAEAELKRLHPGDDQDLAESMILIAQIGSLAHSGMRMASGITGQDDEIYTAALYPLPRFAPDDGLKIDRALLYAWIRQESRFEPTSISRAGATGLMQLMPATARYISRNGELATPETLLDPGFNMRLGQRYMAYLLEHAAVKGDLFRMAVAYNAGPGNLGRWTKKMEGISDPLLFIETIPSRETRNFVKLVMGNYWTYRFRLGQGVPTLAAAAAGKAPMYRSIDPEVKTRVALDK